MRRVVVLALVVAAAALAPAAAATTRPAVGRLWHDFPLGHARLAHTPPPRHRAAQHPRPQAPRSQPVQAARAKGHGTGTVSAALAGSATALTVIGLVVYGRRRGWAGRPADAETERGRRAGTAPRVLAFYAVAAAVGVIVGLLIPLVA